MWMTLCTHSLKLCDVDSSFLHIHADLTVLLRHKSTQYTRLKQSSRAEDIYAAIHRKEYEMKQVKAQHTSTTDPVRMAMGYAQETVSPMRLARALRRVQEQPQSPSQDKATTERQQQLSDLGMTDVGLRRASFVADIKRQSRLTHPECASFCRFDDAGQVAQALVRLGADAVFINVDYTSYGGDLPELSAAVRAVRKVSETAAVVMKDIVVDEIQLGLAKHAGADGILLQSCVLGGALPNFLDLATVMGLETIVECHTQLEVEQALELMAPNILVNNYDRIGQKLHPDQALRLAGLFPGSGGPIVCLATGDLVDAAALRRHLKAGYDGVVVGRAIMGSPAAPELIAAVRDCTLLPAELSQWEMEDADFDMEGNAVLRSSGPKERYNENNVYQ